MCRLEVRCGGLEGEIKELRKSQKETVSELKLEQNSVKQAAYEVREAAERRQQQLGEALAAAEARAAELEEAAAAAGKAAEAAQRSAGKLERQLAELQAEHAELREQHDKVSGWELHPAWLCAVQSVSWVERRRLIAPAAGSTVAAGCAMPAFLKKSKCLLCLPFVSYSLCCSCKRSTLQRGGTMTRLWQTAR